MTDDLAAATIRLVEALKAENAALAALDLPRAGQMLAEKLAAARAFTENQSGKRSRAEMESASADMRALAVRLHEEAAENRRLLERAIAVQTRVLGTLAQAAAATNPASQYSRRGAMAVHPRAAWALSAQA